MSSGVPDAGLYRIHIRKEALKFSAAHMTVFPDGTKERLHGHNYRTEVALDFAGASLAVMVPFAHVKGAMRQICQEWDEKVLLPALCPHLRLLPSDPQEEVVALSMCGKRYVLPRDEVELLPIDNVTTENLAAHFTARLIASLGPEWLPTHRVLRVEVRIDEITGQGASFIWRPV